MNEVEKFKIKLRFATALYKALEKSNFENFKMLALQGGMEPAHLQRITTAKVDVYLSTVISIARAYGVSFTELATIYDGVTKADIDEYLKVLEGQRNRRNAKVNRTKKGS